MVHRCVLVAGLLLHVACNVSVAHEVRPAYLELKQTDADTFDVRWKVPAMGDNLRLGLYVNYPKSCEFLVEPTGLFVGGAYVERLRLREPNSGRVPSSLKKVMMRPTLI